MKPFTLRLPASCGLFLLVAMQFGCADGGSPIAPELVSVPGGAPSIASLTPTTIVAGQPSFALSVDGQNLGPKSVVLWNDSPRSTTSVGSSHVTALIEAKDIAAATTVSIRVKIGSSLSNALALSILPSGVLQVRTRELPDGQSDSRYWAPLEAQGGKPPYRWSLASGQLPDGLALDSSSGAISGNPGRVGHFLFTVRVEDSAVTTTSADASLAITILSPSIGSLGPGCASSGCYGPAIGADGLANTTIGPNGNTVSYRFRARQSGPLQQLRLYLIPDRAGYSGGTGGMLRISIRLDDGTLAHNPSNTTLASYLLSAPLAATPSRYFPLVSFASPPALISGQIYHIVFDNADPNPSANFLSVDALYLQVPTTPVQPAFNDIDGAVLLRSGSGAWAPRKGYTPIMELRYSDGSSEGVGYIESWIGAPQPISGANAVREAFTVSGIPRKVGIVGIRAARISGTDNVRVRLETGDGALIEEGLIASTAFPLNSSPSYRWGVYAFSSSHTLVPGERYHLVLEVPSSSSYQVFPIRKGAYYGFGETTFFRDGSAEFKQDTHWVGWTQWGVANRTDSDLQFYFGLVP